MNKVLLVTFVLLISIITGCSEKEKSNNEYHRVISYKDEEYEDKYVELKEGMTVEEARQVFDGEPDDVGPEYMENGVKYQSIFWSSENSSIGCDFVDDVCDYKNGNMNGVYKKE